MPIDVTKIVIELIGLLTVIITTVAIPLIRAKTTKEKWESAMFWVRIAVKGAEQIYNGTGMGAKKKEFVEKFLTEHNIKLDPEQVDVAIEAAVREMNEAAA